MAAQTRCKFDAVISASGVVAVEEVEGLCVMTLLYLHDRRRVPVRRLADMARKALDGRFRQQDLGRESDPQSLLDIENQREGVEGVPAKIEEAAAQADWIYLQGSFPNLLQLALEG